jgi:hypothetical protein
MSKRRTVQAGDVYELAVDRGFAYLQAVAKHRMEGWAMRILAPLAESVGADASLAVRDASELFVSMMGDIAFEAEEGRIRFVGHAELPLGYNPALPVFRASASRGTDGRHHDGSWWLDDGTTEWRVGSLTREQQSFPYRQLVPALAMRVLIDAGWDPEWEFKGPGALEYQRPPQWNTNPDRTSSFFLLFADAKNASRAVRAISADKRADGVSVLEPSTEDDALYTVVATRAEVVVDELVALDEYFERIAKRFGGEYDGNEVPLDQS